MAVVAGHFIAHVLVAEPIVAGLKLMGPPKAPGVVLAFLEGGKAKMLWEYSSET